ncbi:MAG: carbon starvation protein A, partial [Verrucomicrobiales bacterium]|nr:carbon starvation protein A [Verrucomicrobiales bacterium]
LVITFWLRRRGLPLWMTGIPAIVMLILPALAMASNLRNFATKENWLLFGIGFATILLEIWMIAEAISVWKKSKGLLEDATQIRESSNEGGRSC